MLLGLGVDYAIQYQARAEEEGVDGAARRALPTIATAGLATGAGFLVLLLSPVPMVRGFGLLLVAGILFAFCLAMTAGTAALVALARRAPSRGTLGASVRGAGELLAGLAAPARRPLAAVGRGLRGGARRVTAVSLRRPALVLGVGALLAVGGWALDSRRAWSPTSAGSCRATCPACATWARCSARPACPARST